MVNLGGGFPAHYRGHVPPIEAYADAIMKAMEYHFGSDLPEMVVEPGRYLTGDAGVIRSEVVLVSWKCEGDDKRWVYLDVGIFGGPGRGHGRGHQVPHAHVRATGVRWARW